MRWRPGILIVLLGVLARAALAGPTTAALAFPDAPREGGWELLIITLDVPAPGGVLWLRDARGGVEIGRPVDAGSNRTILLGYPLLAAEQLRHDGGIRWPLRVRLTAPGRDAELRPAEVVTIDRATTVGAGGLGGEGGRSFRVLRIGGSGASEELAALGPVSVATVAADEVIAAPPLALAGADALWIDEETAGRVSVDRAMQLFSAGVRLVHSGVTPPGKGLGELTWSPVARSTVRLAPLEHASLAPPAVVEAGLSEVRMPVARPTSSLTLTVLVLTPAVIVLMLFARAITGRAGAMVAILAACLAGGTALTLAALQGTLGPVVQQTGWRTRAAPGSISTVETLVLRHTLFDGAYDATSTDAVGPLPVASSPGAWLTLDSSLLLDTQAGLTQRQSRVTSPMPARRARAFASRTVSREWQALPASPFDPLWQQHAADHGVRLEGAWWVVNGKVAAASERDTLVGGPEKTQRPFKAWADDQPAAVRPSLLAWYELRFNGRHRYLLRPESLLQVADLGEAREETPPMPPAAPAATQPQPEPHSQEGPP